MTTPAVALVVLGAGGHAAEVCSYIRAIEVAGTAVQLLGCLDDHKPAGHHGGLHVLGPLDDLDALLRQTDAGALHAHVAVGDNAARRTMVARANRVTGSAVRWWTVQHPTAVVGSDAVIEPGCCLAPGAIATSRLHVGAHTILNVKASLAHDCHVGRYVNLNPGATVAGHVRLEDGCFIGAGATVIERRTVGRWSLVGAGAVVIRDVPPHTTSVGVPARPLRAVD